MDLRLSEEQRILVTTARNFLQDHCSSEHVRAMEEDEKGYSEDLWQKMVSLGWTSLVVPEEFGGVGGNVLDLVLLLEEMGRALLPSPFLPTALGAMAVGTWGDESQKMEILPRIAQGLLKTTVAYVEEGFTRHELGAISLSVKREGGRFQLEGRKLFVLHANTADLLICAARTSGEVGSLEGITLFLVSARAGELHYQPLMDIARSKSFEVLFQGAKCDEDKILGPLNGGGKCLEDMVLTGALGVCAMMVGAGQKVLEMVTDYAKQRHQFGRPIGSFQAVQHHCANMAIAVDTSRYITYKVAWLKAQGLKCRKEAAIAKVWANQAYNQVVRLGHQVLGGVGYMSEHDMTLYSRRAKVWEKMFGDEAYHKRIVAEEIGL